MDFLCVPYGCKNIHEVTHLIVFILSACGGRTSYRRNVTLFKEKKKETKTSEAKVGSLNAFYLKSIVASYSWWALFSIFSLELFLINIITATSPTL